MGKINDLSGQKFNRLTVLKFAYIKNRCSYFLCKCECGNEKIIRGSHIKSGAIKSCGCLSKENSIKNARKMGLKYGKIYGKILGFKYGKINSKYIAIKKYPDLFNNKDYKRLYKIYQHMIERCYDKNSIRYKDWGGRGIIVCDEWKNDFKVFFNWALNNGYKNNLTIDRINNNGNYEPNNCKWATIKEQNRNSRNCNYFTYNNKTCCISEWAELYHIKYSILYSRLQKLNWSIEKALNTPT